MRVIDADAIQYDQLLKTGNKEHPLEWAVSQSSINSMPTIKADAVKHGKWIYKGNRGRFPACECSVCGNVENADWVILGDNVNYCPNCGAKMDGDVE